MKLYLAILFLIVGFATKAQINGVVYVKGNEPAAGVTVVLRKANLTTTTDNRGYFRFENSVTPDSLIVQQVGYKTQRFLISDSSAVMEVHLLADERLIEEVQIVNTGFYQIPKDRATGSFTVIGNKLLNRAVGGNILQRLEGIASGVQFVNAGGSKASDIRVRGLSTIHSDASPLIVIDNFPYDGDINSINPNDIDNISILKDAAAASIWGARAGNGVIVITTKQGRYGQKASLTLNSSLNIGKKPDLMYSRNRLPADIVMQIEKEKYEQGGFYKDDARQLAFPYYVEMLIALDKGTMSPEEFNRYEGILRNTDTRDQAMNSLYQDRLSQQYAMSSMGGGDQYTYFVSGAYDRNRANIIGNSDTRLNLNMQSSYKLSRRLELQSSLWYSELRNTNNGVKLEDLKGNASHIGLSPYTQLADEYGNPLGIVKDLRYPYVLNSEKNGLLDWQYRPLEDRALVDRRGAANELRANVGVNYEFLKHFKLSATYQYISGSSKNSVEYDKSSFYVRDLVNRYTQPNGTQVIPYGGVYQLASPAQSVTHSGRMQLNYSQDFAEKHQIVALLGAEQRQFVQNTEPGYTLYNYDPDLLTGSNLFSYTEYYPTRPSGGRQRIPQPDYIKRKFIDRYVSYFTNAAYTYLGRYALSGSARWDGSNLFGVKANQKGTPLWSVGASWNIGMEEWWSQSWLQHLRLKTTYGSAGNVNKSVSAYPTINHWGMNEFSNRDVAMVTSVGNPSLKWERVNTWNIGIESKWLNNRIGLDLDYYVKSATDLIGEDILPPSTGIYNGGSAQQSNLTNYADLNTKGLDVQLSSKNLNGRFQWNSMLLLNYVKNEVKSYKGDESLAIYNYYMQPAVPVVGKSRDILRAIPWFGLSSENGQPLVLIDGVYSQDYASYYTNLKRSDLKEEGVAVSPFYGSFRNTFNYKNFGIDIMFVWKSNYVFRRRSMNSGGEYNLQYHMDYLERWQKPGDEQFTNVPSKMPIGKDVSTASILYSSSAALISKGDHIRLQDINLTYSLSDRLSSQLAVRSIQLYGYMRNLGIVWKANKNKIDPDYVEAEFVAPPTFAFGVKVNF